MFLFVLSTYQHIYQKTVMPNKTTVIASQKLDLNVFVSFTAKPKWFSTTLFIPSVLKQDKQENNHILFLDAKSLFYRKHILIHTQQKSFLKNIFSRIAFTNLYSLGIERKVLIISTISYSSRLQSSFSMNSFKTGTHKHLLYCLSLFQIRFVLYVVPGTWYISSVITSVSCYQQGD